jgi:hypothetical protein
MIIASMSCLPYLHRCKSISAFLIELGKISAFVKGKKQLFSIRLPFLFEFSTEGGGEDERGLREWEESPSPPRGAWGGC